MSPTRRRIAGIILATLGIGLSVAAWYLAIFGEWPCPPLGNGWAEYVSVRDCAFHRHLIALAVSAAGLVLFFAAIALLPATLQRPMPDGSEP